MFEFQWLQPRGKVPRWSSRAIRMKVLRRTSVTALARPYPVNSTSGEDAEWTAPSSPSPATPQPLVRVIMAFRPWQGELV